MSDAAKTAVGRSPQRRRPSASTRASSRPWLPRRSISPSGSIPARRSARRKPSRRCSLDVKPNGLGGRSPTKPIRRWPREIRCSAASSPPRTSSVTTCGTRGWPMSTMTTGRWSRSRAVTSSSYSGSEITSRPSTRSRRAKSRNAPGALVRRLDVEQHEPVAVRRGALRDPAQTFDDGRRREERSDDADRLRAAERQVARGRARAVAELRDRGADALANLGPDDRESR